MSQPGRCLWFEHVGGLGLVAALPWLATRRPVTLAAPCWTPVAARLAAMLARASGGRIRVEVRQPELGRPDGGGRARAYRLERLLWQVSADFADTGAAAPRSLDAAEFRRLLGSYLIARNRDAIAVFTAVEAEAAAGPDRDEHVCFLAFPSLGSFTAAALGRRSSGRVRVRALPSLRAALECVRLLPGGPRDWLAMLRPGTEAAAVDAAARARGVVLEQGYWRAIAHQPHCGHMYWLGDSGLAPGQVVLYCNRPDTPADGRLQAEAAAHGWGWIDGANPLRHLARPGASLLGALRDAVPVLPRRPETAAWVRWALAVSSGLLLDGYRQMIRRYNVAAIHHFTEFSPQQLALCLAARREDAISVWNIWSVISHLLARYNWAVADLILAWGPNDASYHRAAGFDFAAIVEVGLIAADGFAAADDEAAGRLRARFAPGVTVVVAAFDTSTGPLVANAAAHVEAYFDALLGLMESHPDWGLLVKPKGIGAISGLPRVDARLSALAGAGRCVVTGPEVKIGVAAVAADVVSGTPVNSAAVASALLRRRPLVLLDLSALTASPLLGPADDLVCTAPAAFARAVERAADGAAADCGALAALVDGFGDGGGPARAGALLADYVAARCAVGARAALAGAVARYSARHGAARVHVPATADRGPWSAVRGATLDAAAGES